MTNGEKIKEIFPNLEYEVKENTVLTNIDNGVWFSLDWWNAEYKEPTPKNDLAVDCISRIETIDYLCKHCPDDGECFKDCDEIKHLRQMPSVIPQEPRCKECKWWKDSDGEYRRGCGAESQCPINRKEVFEGNGYCFLFEPQESKDKE